MELNTLLTELLADNSGRIGADIEGRTKRITALVTGEFTGKVKSISDLKTIIKSMKSNSDNWKTILYGSNSSTKKIPKEDASEIEDIISIMEPEEIEKCIPENNIDGKGLSTKQKLVYSFIDNIEEQLQKIAIGDYSSLFRSKAKKSYEDDIIKPESVSKSVKNKNIIPIKITAFDESFLGIVRPGSSDGSNGIITWQKIVDNFTTQMDHYEEKYNTLNKKEKDEYEFLKNNFLKAGKLPRTLPLIRRNTSGSELKIHETQEIKLLKARGVVEYKDSSEILNKVYDIIIDVIKDSGKEFANQEAKKLSREQIFNYLWSEDSDKTYDIPIWVISNAGFWSEIEKLF